MAAGFNLISNLCYFNSCVWIFFFSYLQVLSYIVAKIDVWHAQCQKINWLFPCCLYFFWDFHWMCFFLILFNQKWLGGIRVLIMFRVKTARSVQAAQHGASEARGAKLKSINTYISRGYLQKWTWLTKYIPKRLLPLQIKVLITFFLNLLRLGS